MNYLLSAFGMWFAVLIFTAINPSRPTRIVVGDKTYPITYSQTHPIDLQSESTREYGGIKILGETYCVDAGNGKEFIQINPDQSFHSMQDTLWHEAKHASNHCAELDADDIEDLYYQQDPQEIKLMKENPELMEFVTARKMLWQK